MTIDLLTFDDVRTAIRKRGGRKFHLLLGNGFSMAYDSSIFSYNALHAFIADARDDTIARLFDVIKTKDFERVMQQIANFKALLVAFDADPELQTKVDEAAANLKSSLIDAIRQLHPAHVFSITPEQSAACAAFLKNFLDTDGSVFTTNYDLLLYWVLMRNEIERSTDGFGRERLDDDEYAKAEDQEWSELRWGKHRDEQNIHYVHGALPLFDTGIDIVKEEYDESGKYLLDSITERVDDGHYPVFVTAGDGREKLTHIRHNRYLEFCYEQLSQMDGSLVTYGFNFGPYDDHIIGAINRAAKKRQKAPPKLWSIYIGVYSEADREHIDGIRDRFDCKVHLFDSRTAPVWGSHEGGESAA